MRGELGGLGTALMALVLCSPVAWAAGEIKEIVANPTTTFPNQPVMVRVYGTNDQDGTCSQVVVRCQAPAAAEHVMTNITLPFQVTCTYGTTGTKTVTASAELVNADCPGDKITQVKVYSTSTKLVDPNLGKLLVPQIETIFPFSKPSPGGDVLVFGKNFLNQPGKLQIVGQFGTRELVNLEWGPDGKWVGGRVPSDLCGAPDHPAKLVVVTKAGARSNEFPVTFLAQKQWKWLTMSDVHVVGCSNDGNENRCNGFDPGGDDFANVPWDDSLDIYSSHGHGFDPAIAGYHWNCWGCVGNDSGIDKYQITLKNGWTLSHMLLEEGDDFGSDYDVSPPSPGFPGGATSWTPQFSWMASPNDYAWYAVGIEVEGPCGTNYK